jgi:hypothetical protein
LVFLAFSIGTRQLGAQKGLLPPKRPSRIAQERRSRPGMGFWTPGNVRKQSEKPAREAQVEILPTEMPVGLVDLLDRDDLDVGGEPASRLRPKIRSIAPTGRGVSGEGEPLEKDAPWWAGACSAGQWAPPCSRFDGPLEYDLAFGGSLLWLPP